VTDTPPGDHDETLPDHHHGEASEESQKIETSTPSAIHRVVRVALGQPLLTAILAVALCGAGIFSFLRLPVDAYPDLSPPQVEVISQWPGHASEEVERLITVPTEAGMNGSPNLKVMRSVLLYGLSDVVLTFEDGTDNYFARQQVFERLPDLGLPSGVSPGVVPLSSPSGNAWGMPLRMLIDAGDVAAADVTLVGARSLDPPESAFIAESGIQLELGHLPEHVYVALDGDVAAPGELDVFMPEPGGFALDRLEAVLASLPRPAGAGLSGLQASLRNEQALARLGHALGL